MTPRESMIAALERRPVEGRVPHFELVFFLTMEAFGKVHPNHRSYHQWDQMTETERQLHRCDIADLLILTAERFEHSAINIPSSAYLWNRDDELMRLVDLLREKSRDRYLLLTNMDETYAVPNGDKMVEFSLRLAEAPDAVKAEAAAGIDRALARAEALAEHGGLDGFTMCRDYCMNSGPFLSPAQFGEFVAPYLARQVRGFRDLGFYAIKHTDGNIMPILDQLAQCEPHALHSLDPQGGVEIAEVKRLVGDRLCLVGNVNCGALDTGTEDDVVASVRAALRGGMPGGGYVFSTSNCIYTGMRLERYELMLDVWRKEGTYGPSGETS